MRYARPPKRTYVVLIEQTLPSSSYGDTAFVLLGYYDARSPGEAREVARKDYEADAPLVAVSSGVWRAE